MAGPHGAEMAAYWPQAEFDPATPAPARQLARFANTARKIVVSRSLNHTGARANSAVADGGVTAAVVRDKAKAGTDLVIFAGGRFAQTALASGAVDPEASSHMAMGSAMPHPFAFTPSVLLFVGRETEAEIAPMYSAPSNGGEVRMPLGNCGFSQRFGWVNDRFGVSWQRNQAA